MEIYARFGKSPQEGHHIENAFNRKMQRTAKAGVDLGVRSSDYKNGKGDSILTSIKYTVTLIGRRARKRLEDGVDG